MLNRGRHRRPDRVPRLAIYASIALGLAASASPPGSLSLAGPDAGMPGVRRAYPAQAATQVQGGAGSSFTSSTGSNAGGGSSDPASGWTPPKLPDMGRGWRVIIPVLGVNAPVIDLGLNPDGTLEVPTNYQVTGWYSLGPKPGQVGPVVIVGHIDSRNGPAVFYRLDELEPGDKVKVDLGKTTVTFVIESIGQYPKDDFPTDKVYGPVTYPALRLVTCGGVFNRTTGHYADNVVVFAKEA